jgi:hypothetical protein
MKASDECISRDIAMRLSVVILNGHIVFRFAAMAEARCFSSGIRVDIWCSVYRM